MTPSTQPSPEEQIDEILHRHSYVMQYAPKLIPATDKEHMNGYVVRDTANEIRLKAQAEAKAAINKLLIQARLDERRRVTYEHESFAKELFKDRATDIKGWWLETSADAHKRRIQSLTNQLTVNEDKE